MRQRFGVLVAIVAIGALTVGLSSAQASTETKKGTTVKVKLFEFKIKPKSKSVAAGKITFVAKNIGTEQHEMVIALADGTSTDLPTKADGSVDESAIPEANLPGEIPEFNAHKTKKKSIDLAPGTYVLFCNIVDDEAGGTTLSHYAEGMHTTFVVK